MARIFQSGFEMKSASTGIEWDFVTASGAIVSTAVVRSGSFAGKITLASGTRSAFQFNMVTSASAGPFFLRTYINIATLPSAETDIMFFLQKDSPFLECLAIRMTNTGVLRLYNFDVSGVVQAQIGSDSSALSINTWYMVDLKYDATGGAGASIIEGRLNGAIFATASNLTIGNNPTAFMVGGNEQNQAVTGTFYYDDIALNDSTGASQTSYPGAGNIIQLNPSADGDAHNWLDSIAGNPGTVNNFTLVSSIPIVDTSGTKRNLTPSQDFYRCNVSGIGVNDTINVVALCARIAGIGSANASIKLQIEKVSGGTVTQSATITPSNSTAFTNSQAIPRTPPIVLYNDPDGTPWTQATIDTVQIGESCTATSTSSTSIRDIWLSVDYTPSTFVGFNMAFV